MDCIKKLYYYDGFRGNSFKNYSGTISSLVCNCSWSSSVCFFRLFAGKSGDYGHISKNDKFYPEKTYGLIWIIQTAI